MENQVIFYYSLTLAPMIAALRHHLPSHFTLSPFVDSFPLTAQDVLLTTDHMLQTKAQLIIIAPPVRLGSVLDDMMQKAFLAHKPLLLSHGPFTVDRTNKTLRQDEGGNVKLTDKELDLLLFLYSHFPKALSKEQILKNVWHYAADVTTHTVETHIYRLRQKCDTVFKTALIETTDEGYKLYDPHVT